MQPQMQPVDEYIRNSISVSYNTAEPHTPNSMRNVEIRQLNRGYIVDVGCHSFAFSTKEEMMKYLTTYIDNPQETEKSFKEGLLFEQKENN